jgi:hypothetical protein
VIFQRISVENRLAHMSYTKPGKVNSKIKCIRSYDYNCNSIVRINWESLVEILMVSRAKQIYRTLPPREDE